MARLLVVEDDATLRETTVTYLRHAGHTVDGLADGPSAWAHASVHRVDLVLLDLMLPGVGGFEVARRLRDLIPGLPVIMVTARSQQHERIHGLAAGADDYVTKPFSLRELDLRIRAVLRRLDGAGPAPAAEAQLRDGDLVIDIAARAVTRSGAELALTTREFDMLLWFVRHPGQVFAREGLLKEVWGWDVGDASTVTVHVRRLREKVENDPGQPRRLTTVFGHGYRWNPQEPHAG